VRKLALLPILVAALFVTILPANAGGPWDHPGGPKWDNPGNGAWAVETHQPYGVGNGRKFK
jgi:hypothetical protein